MTVAGEPRRVLLVDDDEDVRVTLGRVLELEGYAVTSAADREQAQQLLARVGFDVVVADVQLGAGQSGIKLISDALERDPDLVTIVLTAYVSTEAAIEALRGGATNFLPKPCNISELTAAINRGLERRHLMGELRAAQRDAAARSEAERLRIEAEESRERWQFAAEASRILDSSLDYRTTLESLAKLVVPRLADWCVIDVVERGQLQSSLAIAHADPAKVQIARELQRRYPPQIDDPAGVAEVIRSGQALMVPEITAEMVEAGARDEDHLRIIRELGPWTSGMAVPLKARGRTLGVLTLVTAESRRHYDDDDLSLVEDIASRAALAVDNARLFEAEQRSHAAADRLVDITKELSTSLAPDRVLGQIAQAASALLEVPVAGVFLLDQPQGDFRLAASKGLDAADPKSITLPWLHSAAGRAVRRADAIVVDDVVHGQSTVLPRLLSGEPIGSVVVAPILAGSEALGVVEVYSPEVGAFDEAAAGLLTGLASAAAVALTNARLHRERVSESERLRQIIDQLPEAILVLDTEGRLTASNNAAEQMLGQMEVGNTPHDDHRRYRLTALDGSSFAPGEAPVSRAVRKGEQVHGQQVLLHRAGRNDAVPILVSAAPLQDADGRQIGAMGMLQDITELKDLEQQKDAFLSSAAHDLKTPLTSVQGLVQLLGRQLAKLDVPESERLRDTIGTIDSATKKMTALIDELLDVSRLESIGSLWLDRQDVDLVALARHIVEEQQLTSRRHQLVVKTKLVSLIGSWDAHRVERAISNLVVNAIKYSPNGGEVRIEIELDAEDAVLHVADTGIGIPEADRQRIFERFQRGSNLVQAMPGSGVGLAYVHQVVLQHGGTIDVQSKVGEGSVFTIRLPRRAD
ncbi:MAG: GAF domain-containing protein [Chloroflexi bacterium]|nr:GAF domain-containing protein [Chloroflexota bacterium]